MSNLDDIRDEYAFLDADDRYRLLIDLGRALEPMPEALKTDATLVRGCSAAVWVYPTVRDNGALHFLADSNAAITTRRPSFSQGSATTGADAPSATSSGTLKPVRFTAACSASRVAVSTRATTWACSIARLTSASTTPGTFFSAFSTRLTQEAQVMPSIGKVHSRRAGSSGCRAVSMVRLCPDSLGLA